MTMFESKQSTMFQERSGNTGFFLNAATGPADLPANLTQMIGAEVCHVRSGNIRPGILNRIQFRRVRWQKFNLQPIFLSKQILPHLSAFVRRQRIPDQNQPPSSQGTLQALEIGNNIFGADGPIAQSKKEFYPSSRRCCYQRADSRQTFPAEGITNNWSLPARSPCASDGRTFGKSAFIQEPDECIQSAGFFLIRGHSDRTQFLTVLSLHSRALVCGRWQLQPICRRTRHICRG